MLVGMELMNCPDLAVPLDVMHHVVHVESSRNPFAIGVVGGHLVRQPQNLPEALSTVRMLESRGYNFSIGLAQVNRYNLGKYGLDSYEKAFQICPNLQAGSRILADCYTRSGGDWGKSFSCYYSGNFVTGYRHGYVQKIYASMRGTIPADAAASAAIPVVSRPMRRSVNITRYPVYAAPAQPGMQRVIAATTEPQRPLQDPAPIGPVVLETVPTQGPAVATVVSPPQQSAQMLTATDATATGVTATDAGKPAIDSAFVF
jgi:type IV secretion system protein VirB1